MIPTYSNVLGCQNYYNPLKTTRHHPLPKPVSEVVKHTVKETPRSTAGGLSVGEGLQGEKEDGGREGKGKKEIYMIIITMIMKGRRNMGININQEME